MYPGHYTHVYDPCAFPHHGESHLTAQLQDLIQRLEQLEQSRHPKEPPKEPREQGKGRWVKQLEDRVSTLEQLMLYTVTGQWTHGAVSSVLAAGDPGAPDAPVEPATPAADTSLAYL